MRCLTTVGTRMSSGTTCPRGSSPRTRRVFRRGKKRISRSCSLKALVRKLFKTILEPVRHVFTSRFVLSDHLDPVDSLTDRDTLASGGSAERAHELEWPPNQKYTIRRRVWLGNRTILGRRVGLSKCRGVCFFRDSVSALCSRGGVCRPWQRAMGLSASVPPMPLLDPVRRLVDDYSPR